MLFLEGDFRYVGTIVLRLCLVFLFSLSNYEFDFKCGGVTSLGTVSVSVYFVSLFGVSLPLFDCHSNRPLLICCFACQSSVTS